MRTENEVIAEINALQKELGSVQRPQIYLRPKMNKIRKLQKELEEIRNQ